MKLNHPSNSWNSYVSFRKRLKCEYVHKLSCRYIILRKKNTVRLAKSLCLHFWKSVLIFSFMPYIEKSYLGEICAWVEWTRHQKGSCENGNQSYGSSSGKRIWGETEARKGGGWPSIGKMEGRELIACDMVFVCNIK